MKADISHIYCRHVGPYLADSLSPGSIISFMEDGVHSSLSLCHNPQFDTSNTSRPYLCSNSHWRSHPYQPEVAHFVLKDLFPVNCSTIVVVMLN